MMARCWKHYQCIWRRNVQTEDSPPLDGEKVITKHVLELTILDTHRSEVDTAVVHAYIFPELDGTRCVVVVESIKSRRQWR